MKIVNSVQQEIDTKEFDHKTEMLSQMGEKQLEENKDGENPEVSLVKRFYSTILSKYSQIYV